MWKIIGVILCVAAVLCIAVTAFFVFKKRNFGKKRKSWAKDLVLQINAAIASTEDEQLKSAMVILRNEIQYGNPANNASTYEIEQAICEAVSRALLKASNGYGYESCKLHIQKAGALIAQRNEMIERGQ